MSPMLLAEIAVVTENHWLRLATRTRPGGHLDSRRFDGYPMSFWREHPPDLARSLADFLRVLRGPSSRPLRLKLPTRAGINSPCAADRKRLHSFQQSTRGIPGELRSSFYSRLGAGRGRSTKWPSTPLLSSTLRRRWTPRSGPCIAPCITIPASVQRPGPGFCRWQERWATSPTLPPATCLPKKLCAFPSTLCAEPRPSGTKSAPASARRLAHSS